MKPEVRFKEAEPQDIEELYRKMRISDLEELKVTSTASPKELLLMTYNMTREPLAAFANDELCCVYGVCEDSILTGEGYPWMLATDNLEKYSKLFLKHSRELMTHWASNYTFLRNYVDVRNDQSIRWLTWLGFEIKPAVPFGPYKHPFYPFQMRNKKCAESPKLH